MRHFSSRIASAMAGAESALTDATPAVPSTAVRKNLRRCMCSSQERVLVTEHIFHSAESSCQHPAGWANKKPRRSGAFRSVSEALRLQLVGCRLAGHEVVVGVLGDAEPQHAVLAERHLRIVDLLEVRVL